MVERSLRKIFVRGDRGSIPAAGGLFNRDFFAIKDWRKSNTWTGSSNLATSTRKSCCAISYHRAKRNVAWINRSYDVIFMCWGDVIYPTTQLYNETSNLRRYLYALWSSRLETNRDDWRAMPQAKIWDRKRKRITGWLAGHEIHLEIEDVLDKIK